MVSKLLLLLPLLCFPAVPSRFISSISLASRSGAIIGPINSDLIAQLISTDTGSDAQKHVCQHLQKYTRSTGTKDTA